MGTLVTNSGLAITTGRMIGTTPAQAEPKHVAWGTGAGTTAVGDTTLFTEAAEARVSGTTTQYTTTTTNDTYRIQATITAAAGKTITNAGAFDASSSGNLYVKGDFTGLVLATGESIAFDIRVTYDQA